jgi:hypothetical protein
MAFYLVFIGTTDVLLDVPAAEIVTVQGLCAIGYGCFAGIREGLAVHI